MNMVIIAGHELVDAAERSRYVEGFQDLVRRAREADGCIEVWISPDPIDPQQVSMHRYDATDGGELF